jgi:multidrug efflux pump subunit AcrA (membrane-fusion protein)
MRGRSWPKRVLSAFAVAALLGCSGARDDGATEARRGNIESRVTVGGTLVPLRRSVLSAPYNGYVFRYHADVGDKVKTGQPLVTFTQTLRGAGEQPFPLRAPFDGRIVQRLHQEGEYVETGKDGSGLIRVDDDSQLFVESDVAENDLERLRLGQEAIVRVNAVPDREYHGNITAIALAAAEKTQSFRAQERVQFPVRLAITDKDERLRAGFSVIVDIVVAKKENVVMLPHECIERSADGYRVRLANGEVRAITVGAQDARNVEVQSGIREGERVRFVDFGEGAGEDGGPRGKRS